MSVYKVIIFIYNKLHYIWHHWVFYDVKTNLSQKKGEIKIY